MNDSRRVLVVDDEQDILDLLTIWLEDDARCAAVETAADMPSAFEAVEQAAPDAIVLDLNLGSEKSVARLPELRARCPESRIIVYTASPQAAHMLDVTGHGADTVVCKGSVPVDEVVDLVLRDVPIAV